MLEGSVSPVRSLVYEDEIMGIDENLPVNLQHVMAGAKKKVSPTSWIKSKSVQPESMDSPSSSLVVRQTRQRTAKSPGLANSSSLPEESLPTSSKIPVAEDLSGKDGPLKALLRRKKPRKVSEDVSIEDELLPLVVKNANERKVKTRVVRDKSPNASRMSKEFETEEDVNFQGKSLEVIEKRRSKRSTRRSKNELQGIAETGEDSPGIAKRVHKRSTRQQKRKAPEADANERRNDSAGKASQSRKSKKVVEGREASEAINWVQYITDLIMWKDTPRSAFVFGCGAFCSLSSSLTHDLPFSFVSIASYLCLIYLGTSFLYKSFLSSDRGSIEVDPTPTNSEISEEDVLKVVRLLLPLINAFLLKVKDLFSGDPSNTLKLAVPLWFLAQCGHRMTVWTLARLAFFLAFTIPKFYISYSSHLRTYGEGTLLRFCEMWNACSHKKTLLGTAAALAWKMSSVSTRLFGAFMLVVALRLYQKSIIIQPNCQDGSVAEDDHGNTKADETTGLELMTVASSER